jgi:hypothetical protein
MTQDERLELGLMLKETGLFPDYGKKLLVAALLNRTLTDKETSELLSLLREEKQANATIDREVSVKLQALKTKYGI